MEIWLSYGSTEVPVRVKEEQLKVIHQIKSTISFEDKLSAIEASLDRPFGTAPLVDLIHPQEQISIAVNRFPDPHLEAAFLDAVIRHLHEAKADPSATCIISCDPWLTERGNRSFEESEMDEASKEFLTRTKTVSGTHTSVDGLMIHAEFLQADLKIALGAVASNPFIEWDGAWSSIAPALLERESKGKFLRDAPSPGEPDFQASLLKRIRGLENKLEVDFEIDCLADAELPGSFAYAGKPHVVHKELDGFINKNRIVQEKTPADIMVISPGGRQYDRTLFSSLDPILVCQASLRRNGACVLVGACEDGYGPAAFYDLMREHFESSELSRRYSRKPDIVTLKALLVTRFLSEKELIVVSTLPDYYVHHVFKMRSSKTAAGALLAAERSVEKVTGVAVFRNGSAFSSRALAQ